MRNLLFLPAMVMLLCFCKQPQDPEPTEAQGISAAIIQLANEHRAEIGLDPLAENESCAEVALSHSEDMATGITPFGHDGFDERRERLGTTLTIKRIGENVAFGQSSAEQVMTSWINSEGHRANIEGDFTHIGVGVAEDDTGRLYFTQIFVKL